MSPNQAQQRLDYSLPGLIAPGPLGWTNGTHTYCSHCIGRLARKSSAMRPIWSDSSNPSPKNICVDCNRKITESLELSMKISKTAKRLLGEADDDLNLGTSPTTWPKQLAAAWRSGRKELVASHAGKLSNIQLLSLGNLLGDDAAELGRMLDQIETGKTEPELPSIPQDSEINPTATLKDRVKNAQ